MMIPTASESEMVESAPVSFRLWRDRNFLSLIFGTLFSVIGDGSYFIVLGWFVLSVTGSEFALGTTLTFASIPRIVFMLLGGVVADRIDRKLILVTSLLARALILGLFVVVLFEVHGRPNLWLIAQSLLCLERLMPFSTRQTVRLYPVRSQSQFLTELIALSKLCSK